MARDVTDAHFLHQRAGLEPVVRPPVPSPTALCWVPGREELLVSDRTGRIQHVDPLLGTRVVAEDLGEGAAIAVHEDRRRWVLLTREGRFVIGDLREGELARGKHPFLAGMEALFYQDYVVAVGDAVDGRMMLVIRVDGTIRGRVKLPARVTPLIKSDGRLYLARSTPSGLAVIPFGRGMRFPGGESTAHRLRGTGHHVLGVTPTGVALWSEGSDTARSMRLPDLATGDISRDGRYLGLGTRFGGVALALIESLDRRVNPHLVKAFEDPVLCVAFSDRGRWLATGAEGLQLWTWEEPESD